MMTKTHSRRMRRAIDKYGVMWWSMYKYIQTDYEEFEDTKGVIRIRISKKNRQYNGQKKKYKRTN